MRAVAAAVGVSPMTPYRDFADKAELLTGLWDQAAQGLLTRVREAVENQADARAKLRAHLDHWLAYWEEHPDQYRLVYMTERTTRREDRSAAQTSPVYAQLLALAQDGLRQFAQELGVDDKNVVLADEVRLMKSPWATWGHAAIDQPPLPVVRRHGPARGVFLEETLATVERLLVHGSRPGRPRTASPDRRRFPP